MGLEDIVQITISAQTQTPTRPGFGTPLIAAYHTRWVSDLVREYASLSEMTDDGFLVTDPAYLAAQAVLSQSPRVRKVKVGRRTRAYTQVIKLTPAILTTGYVYSIKVGGLVATYTVQASDTAALISAGLVAAINALANTAFHTAATVSTTHLTVTSSVGVLLDYESWSDGLTFEDTTTDPGIAADLVDIRAEDDDWYGLLLDSNSEAEVLAAAAPIEAAIKLFGYNTSDSEAYDPSDVDDVFITAKGLSYVRTFGMYSDKKLLSWKAAAWMGKNFPFEPGSDTWAYKNLAGTKIDMIPSGRVNAILNKNGNVYTAIAGVGITQFGKSAAGEWIDITRFSDWLRSEIQIQVFSLLINNRKVPYTDLGVDMVRSVILGVLIQGVNVGGLAADPAPSVAAPLVADVDPITKGGRILPDVKFTGEFAGAIHTLILDGTLSV